MTSLMRAGGLAVAVLSLAACGGGSSNSSSDSSSSSSGGGSASVDSCLVNTWVSTGVSGSANGQTAQASGGTGEKVTIAADGAIQIDDSNTTLLNITAGGQSGSVKQTGRATGKITVSGDKLVVTLDPGGTLSNQAVDASGAPVGSPQPAPATVDATYKCSAGQEFQITQTSSTGVSTVIYAPASKP
jgi:hypothetical protein